MQWVLFLSYHFVILTFGKYNTWEEEIKTIYNRSYIEKYRNTTVEVRIESVRRCLRDKELRSSESEIILRKNLKRFSKLQR